MLVGQQHVVQMQFAKAQITVLNVPAFMVFKEIHLLHAGHVSGFISNTNDSWWLILNPDYRKCLNLHVCMFFSATTD
jgi:hypothetical protein